MQPQGGDRIPAVVSPHMHKKSIFTLQASSDKNVKTFANEK